MATALLWGYIGPPASIIMLSAARRTPSAVTRIGVSSIVKLCGRGDSVPLDEEVVWSRSSWKVGATTPLKEARTPGGNCR